MLDEFLIRHSAPTLAGLKTANLFWYSWENREELKAVLEEWQKVFQEKGLGLMVMRLHGQRALLYVYRISRLEQDLNRRETRQMLAAEGYAYEKAKEALVCLRQRIQSCAKFPHEIGLFLGYPQEDVKGFIENEGKNCKCCGCWKVYCNECEARKTFHKFKKCELVYTRLFLGGRPVKKLIVAA